MQRLCFILFALLFFNAMGAPSGNKKPVAAKVPPHKAILVIYKDTANVKVYTFNKAALNKYRADSDFNYTDHAGAGETSFLENLWHWLLQHLFGWMSGYQYAGTIFQYVLIGLGVWLIVYAVSKSMGVSPMQLLRGDSRSVNLPYSESVEDINQIDFDTEIEKALALNNYRLSVRLLYLRSLKQLSDVQLIHWQIDKTNAAYVNELSDPAQKKAFGIITRQFEYVWYGNFNIDKQAFVNIAALFQNFKQLLQAK